MTFQAQHSPEIDHCRDTFPGAAEGTAGAEPLPLLRSGAGGAAGAAGAAAGSASPGLGALPAGWDCGTVLGKRQRVLEGDGLLTCQKLTESPSPHALSNTICCEYIHFPQMKWKLKSLTKKCVRGVNSGDAVNTGGKSSRMDFCFLSTVLHIFNLLCLSAELGFVLKVFSCILHSFTTHRCCLFILFCCFH